MTRSPTPEKFDVFLCHNSADKPQIWEIYDQLVDRGLQPWIDEEHLRPGQFWLQVLGEQIDTIQSAAVFVGNNGIGPWQQQEIASLLAGFLRRNLPVIPVLLPNAPAQPKLPVFLENFTWVDFRKPRPDPMERLIWGITEDRIYLNQAVASQAPVTHAPAFAHRLLAQLMGGLQDSRYQRLEGFLKAEQWKKADEETAYLMETVMGKDEDCLSYLDLQNFPCEPLKAIDGLWVKHSQGRFGFSVQKQIYVKCSVSVDGKAPTTSQVWRKFGDRVGWRNGEWLEYDDLTGGLKFISPEVIPQGLLPAKILRWNKIGPFLGSLLLHPGL